MTLNTKNFGEISINEQDIIHFNEGLPGFLQEKRFVLLNDDENQDSPFYWLQSLDNTDIAFVLIDAMTAIEDYEPEINESDIADLGEYRDENFFILNIMKIPKEFEKSTINLLAPIIINANDKKGKQVIVNNEKYPLRHPINKKSVEEACD